MAAGPAGGAASSVLRLKLPVRTPKVTMPTSMASPPVVVTISAVVAAARLARRDESWPIIR